MGPLGFSKMKPQGLNQKWVPDSCNIESSLTLAIPISPGSLQGLGGQPGRHHIHLPTSSVPSPLLCLHPLVCEHLEARTGS